MRIAVPMASLCLVAFSAPGALAQTLIRVVRADTGEPVPGARVLVERTDKTLLEQGVTDANGAFLSRKLAPPLRIVSISVYPPDGIAGDDIRGIAGDYDTASSLKGIEIRLPRRLLPRKRS